MYASYKYSILLKLIFLLFLFKCEYLLSDNLHKQVWDYWQGGTKFVFTTEITSGRQRRFSYYFPRQHDLKGSTYAPVDLTQGIPASVVIDGRTKTRWIERIIDGEEIITRQSLLAYLVHVLWIYQTYGRGGAYSQALSSLITNLIGTLVSFHQFPVSAFFNASPDQLSIGPQGFSYVSDSNLIYVNIQNNVEGQHAFGVILQQAHNEFVLLVTQTVISLENLSGIISQVSGVQTSLEASPPVFSTFIEASSVDEVTGWPQAPVHEEIVTPQVQNFVRIVMAILLCFTCGACRQ